MAKKPYSDDVKSAICGALFTGAVLGFIGWDAYVNGEISRIYDKVNRSISGLDGRSGTSLGDWNILYQKVLGRELNLGEHPKSSGLAELMKIENALPDVVKNIRLSHIK